MYKAHPRVAKSSFPAMVKVVLVCVLSGARVRGVKGSRVVVLTHGGITWPQVSTTTVSKVETKNQNFSIPAAYPEKCFCLHGKVCPAHCYSL